MANSLSLIFCVCQDECLLNEDIRLKRQTLWNFRSGCLGMSKDDVRGVAVLPWSLYCQPPSLSTLSFCPHCSDYVSPYITMAGWQSVILFPTCYLSQLDVLSRKVKAIFTTKVLLSGLYFEDCPVSDECFIHVLFRQWQKFIEKCSSSTWVLL